MKRALTMVGLTGAMAVAAAMPAMAMNKDWAAGLGFLGGVLVGEATHGGAGCEHQVYCQLAPVVVQPAVIVEQPGGHYEFQREQQWVHGYWQHEQIGCNAYEKVWIPAHYQTVTVKIWIQDA